MTDRIDLIFGKLLTEGLWLLESPYIIPGGSSGNIGGYIIRSDSTCFENIN